MPSAAGATMTDEYDEICQIAINLSRNRQYAVHPVRQDKTPASPHGFEDASTDVDEIARLWRRYPAPLIGIATGERSDLDALDIDQKHDAARAWWHVNAYRLPSTRAYRTRSGGVHLYYRHQPGLGCSIGRIGGVKCPGIDVRATGGYVVFWYADGYPCLDHAVAAEWPPWLLDDLRKPPAPPPATSHGPKPQQDDKAVQGILSAIAGAREGQRNGILFWGACRMAERVQTRTIAAAQAQALLLAVARSAGLDDHESLGTIQSALRGVA